MKMAKNNYYRWKLFLVLINNVVRCFPLVTKQIILGGYLKTRFSTLNFSKLTRRRLRNFDQPEAIIFYGTNSFISSENMELKPGVKRLLKEAKEDGTKSILLSESHRVSELETLLNPILLKENNDILQLRSSKEFKGKDCYISEGLGHCPSPGALLDSIASVKIEPRGFGGSSGFGTKYADPVRSPLPKHCVVFVDSESGSRYTRNRCSASRMAGMRVIYVESNGTCDAEDLVDGVVSSIGEENDWDIVTLDSISTPGSFWLNPPSPRDNDGNQVNPDDVVQEFIEKRLFSKNVQSVNEKKKEIETQPEIDEDFLSQVLADMDPI